MKKINFLFGIHCHQPVGNFEHVIEKAYQDSYLPLLETLEAHPAIKFAVHYSGILYDWFMEKHPEYMDMLRRMVKRGQLEVLTGGYYEPILPLIPDNDKLGQIEMESNFIKKNLLAAPRGMWLTERVWEPGLPVVLSKAGVEYITVDDFHFISAGVPEDDLFGYFTTEDQGDTLRVFPINKHLRYLIPFRQPEEAIDYLRSIATEEGDRAAILADDGEKFGVWPGTARWVFEEKYLERLLTLLEENQEWIKMIHFSEYLDRHPSRGRVYLPDASYFEMMEWSLPTDAAITLEHIMADLARQNRVEEYKRFFKGGFFRNFQVKYPESNNMHKKMLYVSRKLQTSGGDKKLLKQAVEDLYKGQCNCAYWHGIFGGLYLCFLRDAIYHHLIKAENLVQKMRRGDAKFTEVVISDINKDGTEEVLLNNDLINVYCEPHAGGSIFELDFKPAAVNLLATLSRKKEWYHEKIRPEEQGEQAEGTAGTTSIHSKMPAMKEQGIEKLLQYDRLPRYSFFDHFIPPETTLEELKQDSFTELGDFVNGRYDFMPHRKPREASVTLQRNGMAGGQPVKVHKSVSLYAGQSILHIEYEVLNLSDKKLEIVFAPEINLHIFDADHLKETSSEAVKHIKLIDEASGVIVSLDTEKECSLERFPVFTVSQSESGVEKTYQGACMFLLFRLSIEPGKSWRDKLTLTLEV
ncbi:MAG: alpha-amylase/4-alpha-glucanotransferase domain-containing protein [Candidatus Margulisiibacteriota bacterium]